MGYIIYGAGKRGAGLRDRLKSEYGIEPVGFFDTYKTGSVEDKAILDMDDSDRDGIVIIVSPVAYTATDMYYEVKRRGYRHIYWYNPMIGRADAEEGFLERECICCDSWGDNILPELELHIADNCNLNCKGCTHFSPLFDDLGLPYEEKIGGLEKLKGLVSNIARLSILGGEPLLNPELPKYVRTLHKMFPDTFLQIYTNGLLVPKLSNEVLECIRKNNVRFSVTEYLPTSKMIDRITSRFDEFDIMYRITPYDAKSIFDKPVSVSPDSKYPRECLSNGCIVVDGDKIARCPTLMYVWKFNESFDQSLPSEGILDLNEYSSGEKLLLDLKEDAPLCNHCIRSNMDWGVCSKVPELSDFAEID